MQFESETNGQPPTGDDSDLKLMFQCGTPAFASVDIDTVLKDANRSASVAVATSPLGEARDWSRSSRAATTVNPVSQSRRRIIMLSKVGALGLCAASVCVALVFSLLSGNSVLAQVQGALKKVKTASYTATQTVKDQPAQTWKVKLLGDNFYRVDQPNGTYLVFDVKGKKIMEVNPGESKVQFTENLPVPKDYNILAVLTDLKKSAAKAQPGVPNREIGGVMAVGFIVEENGAAYYVWVDPKTNLPLEMEAERKVSLPDGQGGMKEQVVKEHWTDFRFDQQFDESQFTFKAPEGFAVETRQALGRTTAEERDRARRDLERQKAAIEAAKKKAAEKK